MNAGSARALLLAFAAVVLALCEHPSSAWAQAKATSGTGTVYVSRPSVWAASALRIRILVNGKAVGSIGDGQCLKVTLPAGGHKVHGEVVSVLGPVFDSNTDSVQVTVASGSAMFVSITPTAIFPTQHIIYPVKAASKGRSC
jgi:hypothetical protein